MLLLSGLCLFLPGGSRCYGIAFGVPLSKMSQTIFVWTHGGRKVSLAGSWNGWHPEPLEKQGNYFFKILNLPPGAYCYKYVVDSVWQYDLGQLNEDDGSGNWNNYIEVGGAKPDSAPPSARKEHAQPVKKEPPQQQPKKEQQPKQQQQPKKEQQPKQQQQPKKGKQQQQHTPQKPVEPEPEAQVEPEPEPEPEPVHEAPTPTPAAAAPGKKSPETIVVVDVTTADVDTDLVELERFVRGTKVDGLTWEGSQVLDYVFGLKKLRIICKCRDDVSVEEVCADLEKKDELIGSAQIESFAC